MFETDYITWDQLLSEWNVCQRTIYRWQAKAGFPRAFRTPMGWVFSKKRITDWMKERERIARNNVGHEGKANVACR